MRTSRRCRLKLRLQRERGNARGCTLRSFCKNSYNNGRKIKKQKPDFENGWAASLRSGFLFFRHRRSKNTMKYSVFFWNDKITRIFTNIQRNPIRFRLYFCIYLCISVNIRKNPSFFWIFECKRENPTVFTEILDRIYIYIYNLMYNLV